VTSRAGVTVATASAILSAACGAGWHRPAQLEPGPLSPRQQVEVWSGGTVRRWHAVHVEPDSISGIPYLRTTDCDSCRTALPRTAVDSVRLGDPVAGFWKGVGLVLGVPGLILFIACTTARGGCAMGPD
jgi:hypothetical protein